MSSQHYKEYPPYLQALEGARYYTAVSITCGGAWVSDTLVKGNEPFTPAIIKQKFEERGYEVLHVEHEGGWRAELTFYPHNNYIGFLARYGYTIDDAKHGTLSQKEMQSLLTYSYKQLTTEEEVNSLSDGAQVIIWWTVPTGPHRYTVSKDQHGVVSAGGNSIEFVGERKPFTLVWSVAD